MADERSVASQAKGSPKYRKCKACKGTGYKADQPDVPYWALHDVCRTCQGMGVIGKKRRQKHVPQYAH